MASVRENLGDLGVCAVDGGGSESSSIGSSASSVFLCALMVAVVSGVPGTELERGDKDGESE